MSAPRKILVGSISLFALIGMIALVKRGGEAKKEAPPPAVAITHEIDEETIAEESFEEEPRVSTYLKPVQDEVGDQEVDQIWRLFTTGRQKLPIVETVKYRSRVSWLKGRPAWVTDYASHYSTSRHFIARSLNGKPDYLTQKISTGDSFNVLRLDKKINFYLVVDLSRCKMWFYYHDLDSDERVLLKTYKVGLGRFETASHSGLLTPRGKYTLGDKIATYRPGMRGYFQEEEIEMVQVFGTRWIPFEEEISGEGDNPRGYGFHGAPWLYDDKTESYNENQEAIGQYDSDGCIRLLQDDIEELYAIIITKPTIVEIVSDFKEAELPGTEVEK